MTRLPVTNCFQCLSLCLRSFPKLPYDWPSAATAPATSLKECDKEFHVKSPCDAKGIGRAQKSWWSLPKLSSWIARPSVMKSLAAVIIDAFPFANKKKSPTSLQWSPAFSLWRSPRMPMVMPMATKAPAVAICFAPNLPGRMATRLEEDRSRCPQKNLCQWLRLLAAWGTIQ